MNDLYERFTNPYYNNYSNMIIPPEEFRIINFYGIKENMYAISNYGRVVNIISGKELLQVPTSLEHNCYRSLGLQMIDNSRKTFSTHRLVAKAFIPKTQEDIALGRDVINHKNLCKFHNFAWNLEWLTLEENLYHERLLGPYNLKQIISRPKRRTNDWSNGAITAGEKNGMSRLTDEQVHLICQGLVKGLSYYDCALNAGLEGTENDRFVISSIAQRRKHTHISQKYNFPDARTITDFTPYIIPVCELLQQGYTSFSEICKKLELPYDKARHFVRKIKNRQTYTEISKDYKW